MWEILGMILFVLMVIGFASMTNDVMKAAKNTAKKKD